MKTQNNLHKAICMSIGLILCVLLSTQPVYAQGNIHYGRLNVKPSIGASLEHNNNIYLEDQHQVEDLILKLNPEIMCQYLDTRPNNYFVSGLNIELASYFKRNDNNYQKMEPFLLFGLQTPSGFFTRFNERYMKTADPYGASNNYGLGRKTSRSENTIDFTFGQHFTDRLRLEAMYKNFSLRYKDSFDQWQDRTDSIFRLGISLRMTSSRKTSMVAEYILTDATYDRQKPASSSQDYNLNKFLVGFSFEPGSKLSGSAKIGFAGKSFDNSKSFVTDANDNPVPYDDTSTWVIETDVLFSMSDITNLGFRFIRKIEGAPDRDSTSFVDTIIAFDLKHKVHHKTFFKTGLGWKNADYRDERSGTPNKYFNDYKLFFGLDHTLQDWLKISSTYSYETQTASHSDWFYLEYSVSKLIVEMNAMF